MFSIWGVWMAALADPSQNVRHYYNIFFAVVFFFVAQLLICAWDQPFWAAGVEFPGQIIAMIFVWLIVWGSQISFCQPGEGIDKFYHQFLRAPTEILNKHMSIGFTVPFLNLINHQITSADQVGFLVAAYVVTGVLNSIFVYAVAYHIQLSTTKTVCCMRRRPAPDVETARTQVNAATLESPQRFAQYGSLRRGGEYASALLDNGPEGYPRRDRSQKHISDSSTLCTMSGYASDLSGSKAAYGGDIRTAGESQDDQCRPSDTQLHTRERHDVPGVDTEILTPPPSAPSRVPGTILTWLPQNILLTLSLLFLLVVGLPISFLHQNDLYLDLGFLFTVWLTFTSAQARTKQHLHITNHHRKALTAVAMLLNPVLWTSLFLVCYGLAKSSIRNQPSASVISGFTSKNTVSDLIAHHIHPPGPQPGGGSSRGGPRLGRVPIGAGDVATSILNAGIVSWGLKLFEYRHQIVSSGGLTVVATSLLASLLNVAAWPLLARAVGVYPAGWDLSFAARSVTIALGGPAMRSLGGDAAVNAVGVVVNGICFQLAAGFFSAGGGGGGGGFAAAAAGKFRGALVRGGWAGFVWSSGVDEEREMGSLTPSPDRGHVPGDGTVEVGLHPTRDREVRYSSDATHVDDEQRPHDHIDAGDWGMSGSAANSNAKHKSTGDKMGIASTRSDDRQQGQEDHATDPVSVVPTVAAGVTIGINAAAMGTSHLYEQNSRAAPYSALSMTMFGVFTVLFTVRGPITAWLVKAVGGGESGAAMML